MPARYTTTRLFKNAVAAIALTFLALAVTSCDDQAKTKSLGPAAIEEIDNTVAAYMKEHGSPGAMVGVWVEDGTVFVKAYGLASEEAGLPMDQGMSFRIGSVTKSFTGNLVLQLVDAGLLSLDDPVSRLVPGIPDGDQITIRMLLDHTSGLFNYGVDAALNQAIAADPHRVWAPEELVAAGTANPPYFPPRSGSMYSNTNYVLLGMIVESATGRSFEEELADRITGPLGLVSTYMAEGPCLQGDHVHGYTYDPASGQLYDITDYLDPSVVWAAGGMVSTLQDLRVWGRAMGTGTLLEPSTFEVSTSDMSRLPIMSDYFEYPIMYGLGIMEDGGWLGHGGMQPGYTAAVFYLPEREATIVTAMNVSDAEEPAFPLFMQVAKIVFPEETPWERKLY